MMAFFREGVPSGGVYLTSPEVSLAAELRMAVIGALFFGSPMLILMTGSPRSLKILASSLSASVGDSAIVRANWLIDMGTFISKMRFYREKSILQGEKYESFDKAINYASM